ncbi:hypothetical protein Nepgr_022323 [Nepenthes gracilis]|uniref:Uncharacterized protein n=1 Tax=Nepenthes gracilis TaxID=150966 RepID=A0AAD3T0Q4_NEPGR|nr:hypothetical protein Nepgr_022323 [Nepenthes gracilis]
MQHENASRSKPRGSSNQFSSHIRQQTGHVHNSRTRTNYGTSAFCNQSNLQQLALVSTKDHVLISDNLLSAISISSSSGSLSSKHPRTQTTAAPQICITV